MSSAPALNVIAEASVPPDRDVFLRTKEHKAGLRRRFATLKPSIGT
jgi:hypothetical protein